MANNQSKIERLIAELCPNGVEFMELSAVCKTLKKGTLKTGELIEAGEYPVMNSGRDFYGRYDNYNNEGNSITIAARGEYAGFINYIGEKFWAGGLCYPFSSKDEKEVLTKFVFYALKEKQQFIRETLVARGSIPALNKSDIDKFKIPIPPLEIQEKIVDILDTFTQLEAELEAELEARKKQYEHYYFELLTFDPDIEQKTLEEVSNFRNGKGHEKQIDENGKYIVVNSKFVSTNGVVKKYSATQIAPVFKDDILMVMSDLPNGKALAKCFYVDEDDTYTLNQRICALNVKNTDELNAKYFYYILNRNRQLLRYDNGVDQTNLRKGDILKIQIPIPPLSEQKRIVAILDKFDALVNDISIGLPAEIKARRQQYEYYRGKLLTFNELAK